MNSHYAGNGINDNYVSPENVINHPPPILPDNTNIAEIHATGNRWANFSFKVKLPLERYCNLMVCVLLFSQVRLEWPTDLAVNPMDNSLYVLDNNIVLQISENRRVRIIAGRPIHCQVPGIDHFLVSKVAIHSTLESARAISVSHSGLLFIAETDERKVNRIQQVTTNGEISIIAGAPTDCDCKIDPNCDCFSGMTFLAIHQLPLCFQKKNTH